MFGPYYYGDPPPPPKPPTKGTQWIRTGESLWWSVIDSDPDRVVLEGPGACTGKLYLDLTEFYKDFRRV